MIKQFLTDNDIWHFTDWDAIVVHRKEDDVLCYTAVGFDSFFTAQAVANGFIAQIKRHKAPLLPFEVSITKGKNDFSIEYLFQVLDVEKVYA